MPIKVRDLIKELVKDGWGLDRQAGSHRIFKHPTKPNNVSVPGRDGQDVPTGTEKKIRKDAGI